MYVVSSAERELPADWDHFHILLEQLLKRVPNLQHANLERLCNGPEAFSPDCNWILGECPEVCSCSIFSHNLRANLIVIIDRLKTIWLRLA